MDGGAGGRKRAGGVFDWPETSMIVEVKNRSGMAPPIRVRRKKRETWILEPGDLPSSLVVLTAPRLPNLQNNACFRMIMHQSKLRFGRPNYGYLAIAAGFSVSALPFLVLWASSSYVPQWWLYVPYAFMLFSPG